MATVTVSLNVRRVRVDTGSDTGTRSNSHSVRAHPAPDLVFTQAELARIPARKIHAMICGEDTVPDINLTDRRTFDFA